MNLKDANEGEEYVIKGVSTNDEELKNARMQLSKLVREVDKCIALLNE